ncbi:MAG: hypothetical protein HY908_23100 [Myxococcales bacterium]|nr:hypothetical protein [Myxococcales bacterium]
MRRVPFLHPLAIAAFALTLGIVALLYWVTGGGIASPGALSARRGDGTVRGGVASHAELARRCSACHPAPFSGASASQRCLGCHDEVAAELGAGAGLHARLRDARRCLVCHLEHEGPDGELTRLDAATFPHDATGFALTGAHARVPCAACHRDRKYANTPKTCLGCHEPPDGHREAFGDDCGSCHGTDSWQGARFDHGFPLDHGAKAPSPCKTCHPDGYKTYTCYGCHEHTPANIAREHDEEGIADLADCAHCHPTGREKEGGDRKHGGDRKRERERRGGEHDDDD